MIVSYPATRRPWIPPVRMIKNYNEEWFEVPDNFFTDFAQRTPANKYQRMNIAQDLDLIDDLFLRVCQISINQSMGPQFSKKISTP